jgi:hypothetical protein
MPASAYHSVTCNWEEMQEKSAEVNVTKANLTAGRATQGVIEHNR